MSLNGDIPLNKVAYYHSYEYNSLPQLNKENKMRGPRRVLIFCLLTAIIPTILLVIPLYLKHIVYADVTYAVAESDVIEITDGLSSLFCAEHRVAMNTTFHAFQVDNSPQLSDKKKHIQLLKDMNLPDDTFEYWGFFLPKGSNVILSACSRFEGGRVLIVQGEKNLKTCSLLERTKTSLFAKLPGNQNNVKITYETNKPDNKPEIHAQMLKSVQENDTLSEMEEIDEEEDENHDEDKDKNLLLETLTSLTPPLQIRHRQTKERHLINSILHKDQLNKLEKLFKGKDTEEVEKEEEEKRFKRELMKPSHVLDAGVGHGGTGNITNDESSASSFENDLIECYKHDTLTGNKIPTSDMCTKHHILENNASMQISYDVPSDGYYYYIFYSDNDIVTNHIYGIFDIHKPTYQFTNYSKGCINETECTFTINFWNDKTVIVEIPTRDGLKSDLNDHSYLISSCRPRMWVYAFFPIIVIFLILACAFI